MENPAVLYLSANYPMVLFQIEISVSGAYSWSINGGILRFLVWKYNVLLYYRGYNLLSYSLAVITRYDLPMYG